MKILIKSVCVAFILTTLFAFLPFEQECKAISDEVLRIHILANSDSVRDQKLKIMVRDAVLNYTDGLFSNVQNKTMAVNIAQENIDAICKVAEKTLAENGCCFKVGAELTDMDFDTRYYGDITMPSGNYTALRLTIGEGKGKNWWCVMYPSLCLYSCSDTNTLEDELSEEQYEIVSSEPKYEFKFKFLEYFNFFCSWFS